MSRFILWLVVWRHSSSNLLYPPISWSWQKPAKFKGGPTASFCRNWMDGDYKSGQKRKTPKLSEGQQSLRWQEVQGQRIWPLTTWTEKFRSSLSPSIGFFFLFSWPKHSIGSKNEEESRKAAKIDRRIRLTLDDHFSLSLSLQDQVC